MPAAFTDSIVYLMTSPAMLWCAFGVVLGVVAGAIPGLGGGMLMALLLPVTFAMDSVDAQIFLVGIYVGGVSGGLISGVLLGVPGSPASVMTVLDGHAMTRQGKAAQALSVGIMASVVGGMFSWALLVLLSAPLAAVAAQLQSFDYFAIILLGMALIAVTGAESPLRGIVSGLFGIVVATVGFDAVSATNRFTFGIPDLANGFHILPVLIGAFAVRQVLSDAGREDQAYADSPSTSVADVFRDLARVFRYPANLVRSSVVGSLIGMMPGIGANIAAVISYTIANRFSRNRAGFGKGEEEGVIASEAGNNSSVGGALMPMISLGIPGSGQDVILMAALVLHHVQPGPLLLYQQPEIFYGIISGYMFANLIMLVVMVVAIRYLAAIIRLPVSVLIPSVLLFCVVGVIAANNRLTDAWVMMGFGIVGYLMAKHRYPLPPFIIGFVLTPLGEERLRSSLMGSSGDWLPLLSRPVALVSIIAAVIIVLWPMASAIYRRLNKIRH